MSVGSDMFNLILNLVQCAIIGGKKSIVDMIFEIYPMLKPYINHCSQKFEFRYCKTVN